MDFSELSKYSGLACFSSCGRFLATTEQNKIIVRHSDTLQTLHHFACLDGICCISFSPDSTLIFGAQYKRRIVQVFSLKDPSWTCKIDEALAGLIAAQWSPDSRHILTRSEFNLRLSCVVTRAEECDVHQTTEAAATTERLRELNGIGYSQCCQ